MNKRAFTLVEVLVASLLLSMLVVILTMVFNQSSIAWRTGKAGVAEMDKVRRYLSQTQRQAENLLPGVDANRAMGRVVSAWDDDAWNGQNSALRRRAVAPLGQTRLTGTIDPSSGNAKAWQNPQLSLTISPNGSFGAYTVGVWSYGPDGQPDTEDDISTWPDEME